jgi:hypothetical protein
MYKDLAAMRAANEAAGKLFFDPETLKFWQSRVSSKIWPVADGAYFVTSERVGDGPRRYSVRFIGDDGNVSTIGDFRGHATMAEAQMHARGAADAHHIPMADA